MEEKKGHSNGLFSMQQKGEDENFPIGLKVLAIDANIVCLKYLVLLLRKCQYKGTSFSFDFSSLKKKKNV